MSVDNRGLVAKKRALAPAKKLPRLLMGMLADLPLPSPTKRQVELQLLQAHMEELAYRDHDHFDLEQAASAEEKTYSSPLKEPS